MSLSRFRMKTAIFNLLFIGAVLLCGCRAGVEVKSRPEGEYQEYSELLDPGAGFTVGTVNLLGNYLLSEQMKSASPEHIICSLLDICRSDKRREVLAATAETALFYAEKFRSNPDKSISFLGTALLFSYAYLNGIETQYPVVSQEQLRMFTVWNQALTGVFLYLNKKNIAMNSGYELKTACRRKIYFRKPVVKLPVPEGMIKEFLPCAAYRVKGLTHYARAFGIGVPLICRLDQEFSTGDKALQAMQTIPATLLFHVCPGADAVFGERVDGELVVVDSAKYDYIRTPSVRIALEQDFSTPLACLAGFNVNSMHKRLYRTFFPENSRHHGLYLLNPRDDKRIPVLFVHGLMSDIHTWMQMVNTLQSDPELRRNYRFMGFSYSSGNPVLFSADLLRDAIADERARLLSAGGDPADFDRMVVIGHSMGGLLSRILISSSTREQIQAVMGNGVLEAVRKSLDREQRERLHRTAFFSPVSSVQRVIFIATPHRGSRLALSWYGRLGARLIRLPQRLVERNEKIVTALLGIGKNDYARELKEFNGIYNLAPEGMLTVLLKSMSDPQRPYHSVIGNLQGVCPGGSDGVVAYSSSHLDGAESELIVRSGHSVQQNPLAIQEVRRILLAHLKSFPERQRDSGESVLVMPGVEIEEGRGR